MTTPLASFIATLEELQPVIHKNSRAKGWYDPPEGWREGDTYQRNIPEMLALFHSEVTEAQRCYEMGDYRLRRAASGKPEGLMVELADVVIRALDLAEYLGFKACNSVKTATGFVSLSHPGITGRLLAMHAAISDALEAWRAHHAPEETFLHPDTHRVTGVALEHGNLILGSWELAAWLDLDLEAAIRAKNAYNLTRPHRHGGKKA